eukprot:2587591-Pleurochrysis_carterae.AAC.2
MAPGGGACCASSDFNRVSIPLSKGVDFFDGVFERLRRAAKFRRTRRVNYAVAGHRGHRGGGH